MLKADLGIQVFPLPKTDDEQVLAAQAHSLRNVRLRALERDPQGFRVKYNDEVDKPLDFWIDRLRPAHVTHFVVAPARSKGTTHLVADESTEFLGVLVVVAGAPPRSENPAGEGDDLTYALFSVWIDPSLRGRGAGSEMIRESIEWIKADASTKQSRVVRVNTSATQGNARAVRFYQKLGFVVDELSGDDEQDHGETPLTMRIDTAPT